MFIFCYCHIYNTSNINLLNMCLWIPVVHLIVFFIYSTFNIYSTVLSLEQQQKLYTRQQFEGISYIFVYPIMVMSILTDAAISQSNHEAGRTLVTLTNQSPVVCKEGGICRRGVRTGQEVAVV